MDESALYREPELYDLLFPNAGSASTYVHLIFGCSISACAWFSRWNCF